MTGVAVTEQGEIVDATPDAGMTVESIRLTIYRAADLCMPRMDKHATLSANIERVQDYLIETAVARSELERARLYAWDAYAIVRDQWDEIPREAYEDSKARTNLQVDAAKATLEPQLSSDLRTIKRLIDRLSDQIQRLELDDKAASRTFTMLVGG